MVFSQVSPSELIQQDREHLIHPLYHPDEHESPIIFAQGKGAILTDVEGHEYIDGLSCLWNVAVGHGRTELAEAVLPKALVQAGITQLTAAVAVVIATAKSRSAAASRRPTVSYGLWW